MSDKMTWLTLIDKQVRREKNLSLCVKLGILVILYFVLQIFGTSITCCIFALCLVIMGFCLDVLVNQKKQEYSMLYEQARNTPPNEVNYVVEPTYSPIGRKNGKADFWHLCADWQIWLFYAFFFILNLALLIVIAVKG